MLLRYIIKRLGQTLIVMLCVAMVAFFVIRLAPGNPAIFVLPDTATPEEIHDMEVKMGLDRPVWEQFGKYLWQLLHGDLGMSTAYKLPAFRVIMGRLPITAKLALFTVVFGCILAIPLGIIAGSRKGTAIDFFAMFFALLGLSMATVWLCVLMVYIFSLKLGWLPAVGCDSWKGFIAPTVSLGYPMAASITRVGRSGMIDTLSEDYITAAYAKGVGKFELYWKYAFRNALIPIITLVGLSIGGQLAGAVVAETVFVMPGIGQLVASSVNQRDYTMVQALLLFSAMVFAVVNMIVDIINSWVDPRMTLN